ncbi:uncharacterized protein B0H18DRAFT_23406 [Fomitopsis serialis]|uniref:uncharacterized protein n=1 Tax=Fomitopsis serialis TaxID=139415 RepID=UPI002007B595|nr:uncharacterized protein B0H18DRAFT_23406 [Neoantrodia serialis]KAH9938688.1 hypothetical protein B0H18DRAFT_23406 [Neoantrodia serialis]
MHGEIIMGTLLVVLFFKSLEVQKARDASAEQAAVDANSTPLCPDGCSPFVPIQRDYSFRLSRTAVDTMNSVLREIDKAVEAPPPAEADGDDRLAPALQALANLAMLLDTGQLPTDRISTLVHSLYSCPKTDHHVWILDRSNKPVRVKAYQYFHSVLMRLIHSLTKPEPLDRPPRLDIGSYNALLFYALRHRLSPALAASILDHMCCKRKPPIQPTIVTYNTLIRAGTLTRRQDITDLALRALRERCEWSAPASEVESTAPNMAGTKGQDVWLHNSHPEAFQSSWKEALPSRPSVPWPGLLGRDAKGRSTTAMNVGRSSVSQCSAVDPPTVPAYRQQSSSLRRDRSSPAPPPGARQSRVLQRLDEEDWEVPEAFVNAPVDVPVNARTLAEYVTHVTATGKPGVIANVLFRMMPELAIVDHPTWGRTDDSRRRSPLPPRLRKRYLRRAVRHGPHVYSALLNALAKAKKTGAAERVWLLAKQAEQASWVPNFVPDVEPWCLPVHAYTSMMRCYAQEANRAISRGRREQASSDQALRQGDDKWVPLFRGVIPGWAAFVTTMQKLHLPKYSQRRRRLRSVAGLLHRCMVSAGLSLYRSLLAWRRRGSLVGSGRDISLPPMSGSSSRHSTSSAGSSTRPRDPGVRLRVSGAAICARRGTGTSVKA